MGRKEKLEVSDRDDCVKIAIESFESAYSNFEKHNHLKGMFLAKKRYLSMLFLESDRESRMKTIGEVSRLSNRYKTYWTEVGLVNSCYIPREHGDEISLL